MDGPGLAVNGDLPHTFLVGSDLGFQLFQRVLPGNNLPVFIKAWLHGKFVMLMLQGQAGFVSSVHF